jgi:hypothetical protein
VCETFEGTPGIGNVASSGTKCVVYARYLSIYRHVQLVARLRKYLDLAAMPQRDPERVQRGLNEAASKSHLNARSFEDAMTYPDGSKRHLLARCSARLSDWRYQDPQRHTNPEDVLALYLPDKDLERFATDIAALGLDIVARSVSALAQECAILRQRFPLRTDRPRHPRTAWIVHNSPTIASSEEKALWFQVHEIDGRIWEVWQALEDRAEAESGLARWWGRVAAHGTTGGPTSVPGEVSATGGSASMPTDTGGSAQPMSDASAKKTRGSDGNNETQPFYPTMEDLAAEAGISNDTFRRVRTAANIVVKLKGAAVRSRRYCPKEVDMLIFAALAGTFVERKAMAEKWAKWGSPPTQGSGK